MLKFFILILFPFSICAQANSPIQIGSSTYDQVRSLEVDEQGNMYVTGIYTGTVNFDPMQSNTTLTAVGNSNADVFLAKYNTDNVLEWILGLGGVDYDYVNDLVLIDDAIIIGGYYSSSISVYNSGGTLANVSPFGGQDLFLLQTDIDGNLDWIHGMGSTQNDQITAIGKNANNDILIAGIFFDTIDLNPDAMNTNLMMSSDAQDSFIAAYDINGGLIGATTLSGTGFENINDLVVDVVTNDIYVTGYFDNNLSFGGLNQMSQGAFDIFLAKFDQNLDETWIYTTGGIQNDQAVSLCISDNGIGMVGRFFNSFDFGNGYTITSNGQYDTFFSLFDTDGTLLNIRTIGGSGLVEPDVIEVDEFGNYWVGGTFNTNLIEPNIQEISAGGDDIFLLKFDPSFQLESSFVFGGSSSEGLADIFIGGNGSTWLGGFFQNTVSFGMNPDATITSNGSSDGMIVFLEGSTVTSLSSNRIEVFNLFPNPAKEKIQISFPGETATISILHVQGRVLGVYPYYKNGDIININYLSSGTYYVMIDTGGESKVVKFVKP